MIGVVVSRADEASERIGEHLLALRDWDERADPDRPDEEGGGTCYRSGPFELRTFEDLHLYLDDVAEAFTETELVVFASRHSGETGPLLTGHFTGNFGPAEYGGSDGELAIGAPAALDLIVDSLAEYAPEGYETGIECTHHGPSEVGTPSLFVEVGSGPDQWADDEAAAAVARAILALESVSEWSPEQGRTLIGLGGGHYAPRFERIIRETGWTVGHVGADWGLEALGELENEEDVLARAFERSGANHALVVGDHPEIETTVEELGYRAVDETWVRETDGVPLELVERLEAALCPVGEGLRFGEPANAYGDGFEIVELPDELLAEARSVDRERTRAAVEKSLLAFETDEGGTIASGAGAVASRDDRKTLIDDLVDVLADGYESVRREGGEVVVHKRAFDPARASELGVPEGPAFGKLAAGKPVEVGDRTIEPDDVTVSRTYRIPLN